MLKSTKITKIKVRKSLLKIIPALKFKFTSLKKVDMLVLKLIFWFLYTRILIDLERLEINFKLITNFISAIARYYFLLIHKYSFIFYDVLKRFLMHFFETISFFEFFSFVCVVLFYFFSFFYYKITLIYFNFLNNLSVKDKG